MIWDHLNEGIHFEESTVKLDWNSNLKDLRETGDPEVSDTGGQIKVTWKERTLLEGIKGDWSASYFTFEERKPFKSISLSLSGDKRAFERFVFIKQHLLERLGTPSLHEEDPDEEELRWEKGKMYIHLYFFEMHAYRCTVTIGVKLDRSPASAHM